MAHWFYLFIYLLDQALSRTSYFSTMGFQVGSHFTYTTRNPKKISVLKLLKYSLFSLTFHLNFLVT